MKILHLIFTVASVFCSTQALFSGFALESKLPTGECRNQSDWEFAFQKIANFPGNFKNVRLFVSDECNTLANAVPAALKTGTTLVVGIWTEDDDFFNNEKQALLSAIQKFGTQWIIAVLVGSEDVSRKDIDPNILATRVFDVRGMVRSVGVNAPVGHADTAEAWIDPASTSLIDAVDFIGVNNYPYWRGVGVENGAAIDDFFKVTDNVRSVAKGKDVWTTETGQPITGSQIGDNIPSLQAQQIYWWEVACKGMQEMNFFMYDLDDFQLNPRFAVVNANYTLQIDMSCSKTTMTVQLPVVMPSSTVPASSSSTTSGSSDITGLPFLVAVTFSIPGQSATVMPVQFIGTPAQSSSTPTAGPTKRELSIEQG